MTYGRLVLLLFIVFSLAILVTGLLAWVHGMNKLH